MPNYNNNSRMVYNKMYCKRSINFCSTSRNSPFTVRPTVENGAQTSYRELLLHGRSGTVQRSNRTTVQSAYQHYNLPINIQAETGQHYYR